MKLCLLRKQNRPPKHITSLTTHGPILLLVRQSISRKILRNLQTISSSDTIGAKWKRKKGDRLKLEKWSKIADSVNKNTSKAHTKEQITSVTTEDSTTHCTNKTLNLRLSRKAISWFLSS